MRILLDECVPRRLRRELSGHDVGTVPEMGWSGKTNGELLQLMVAQGFDVLLTVDQNLRYQQNVQAVGVAVVVLVAASNRLADLVPLIPSVQAALGAIRPGDATEITAQAGATADPTRRGGFSHTYSFARRPGPRSLDVRRRRIEAGCNSRERNGKGQSG